MGNPSNRPFCYKAEQAGGTIFLPTEGSSQSGPRCPIPVLGGKSGVCVSTFFPHSKDYPEDKSVEHKAYPNHIILAKEVLVLRTTKTQHHGALETALQGRPHISGRGESSRSELSFSDGLASEREL